MPNFVKSPNLPARNVTAAAVGEDYAEEIAAALCTFGVKILCCPNNPNVDIRLRSHIDLSVFHIGGNRLLLSRTLLGSSFEAELNSMGAETLSADSYLSSEYPQDSALCVLSNGELLFHNLKFSDKHLLNNTNVKKINVKQGYAKCAVCFVNETAAMTADRGLSSVMKAVGMDVLEISPVGIELKGYNEGFIGGAAFKIAPDKLAFTGKLDSHPDKQSIFDFLLRHEVEPIFLSERCIFDIGSVIPLTEI